MMKSRIGFGILMAVGFSWDESKPMIHDTNILRYLEQPPSTNRNSRLPTAASTAQDYHRGVRPWHILSCSSSKMGASQNAIPLQKLHFYWENEDKPATIKRHHIICRTYGKNMEKSKCNHHEPSSFGFSLCYTCFPPRFSETSKSAIVRARLSLRLWQLLALAFCCAAMRASGTLSTWASASRILIA